MAPVTRRRSNIHNPATEEGEVASPASQNIDTSEVLLEEPAKKSGKRKSTGAAQQDQGAEDATPDTEFKTPKRQRLSVRTTEEKTASGGRKKRIEAEIPSSSLKPIRSSPVPDSEEESDDGIGIELTSATKQLEEDARHQLASQSLDSDPTPQPKPKSKHVVFGDDDDVENFVAAGAETEIETKEAQVVADSDDESDDDDDAPEAVSTQAAAKERLKSTRAATIAAEKHAASLKRKRQERDNLFKQQAEKRKQTLPEDRGRARSSGDSDDHHEDAVTNEGENATTTTRQRRVNKYKLPALLPAEFLADSSSESEDETVLKKVVKRPKKITFDTATATAAGEGKKPPRDRIVGTTRYRVLEGQKDSQKLAPKVNRGSRIAKEVLLKRGRKGAAPKTKKGFFVRR